MVLRSLRDLVRVIRQKLFDPRFEFSYVDRSLWVSLALVLHRFASIWVDLHLRLPDHYQGWHLLRVFLSVAGLLIGKLKESVLLSKRVLTVKKIEVQIAIQILHGRKNDLVMDSSTH